MSDFDLLENFSKAFELMTGGWEDAIGAIGGLVDAFHLSSGPDVADMAVQLKKLQDCVNKVYDEWDKFFKEQASDRAKKALESQNEYFEKEREYFKREVLERDPERDPQWAEFVKELQDDYQRWVRFEDRLEDLRREVDELSEGFSEGAEEDTDDVEEFDNSD